MSYVKHNFNSGEKLYSSQLNEMDEQILKNEEEINTTKEDLSQLSESIAEISELSKNELPSEAITKTVASCSVSYAEGTISVVGTSTQDGGRLTAVTPLFRLDEGHYILSKDKIYTDATVTNNISVVLQTSTGTIIATLDTLSKSVEFDITNASAYYMIGLSFSNGKNYNIEYHIQIEKGAVATDWHEPSYRTAIDNTARGTIEKTRDEIKEELKNKKQIDLSDTQLTQGKAVRSSNGNLDTLANHFATDPIDIHSYRGYKMTIKSVLNGWSGFAFYDNCNLYITGYSGSTYGNGLVEIDVTIPNNAQYIRFTTSSLYGLSDCSMVVILSNGQMKENINDLSVGKFNILSAFTNIYCIGDSLTYGQVYTGLTTSRRAITTYPQSLGKMLGVNVSQNAIGGYTSLDWWNRFNDQIASKDGQLVIVYLGTNGGLSDTVASDVVGDDYTQWATNNTGSYAKIIAKSLEVGARVLLIKPWSTSGNLVNTHKVIDQLASMFGCGVVEPLPLEDRKYHLYPDRSGVNNLHLNDLGYCAFASALIEKVSLLSEEQMKWLIPN